MSPRDDLHRDKPQVFDAITAGSSDPEFSFVTREQAAEIPVKVSSPAPQKKPQPAVEKPVQRAPVSSQPTPVQQAAKTPTRTRTQTQTATPTLLRTTVLWSLLALTILAVAEGGSLAAYRMLAGTSFSFTDVQRERAEILGIADASAQQLKAANGTATVQDGDSELVMHPYLGYIQSPTDKWVTDDHGVFYDSSKLITVPNAKRLVVGVFGGSLAEQFSAQGSAALRNVLALRKELSGKDVTIVPVAFAGYKQPQQLIALNYLLSRGAYFDVIVNIDGFNEVALATTVNRSKKVSPYFPSSWGSLVGGIPDVGTLRLLGKTVNLRDIRKAWAAAFQGSLGNIGVAPNLVWFGGDRMLASALSSAELELEHGETADTGDKELVLGPSGENGGTDEALLRELVETWERSSQQMHDLAAAKGITYIHVLQPNQYVPDSKQMDEAEAKTALNDQSPFRKWVVAGYPLLREAGLRLKAAGVDFVDATDLFADVREPAYSDDCCHLNATGYEMLGMAIGEEIAQQEKATQTKAF